MADSEYNDWLEGYVVPRPLPPGLADLEFEGWAEKRGWTTSIYFSKKHIREAFLAGVKFREDWQPKPKP